MQQQQPSQRHTPPAPRAARRRRLATLLAASAAAMALNNALFTAEATTLFWDGDGVSPQTGGTGSWNTTSAHFSTTGGGTVDQIWNNNNVDSAVFNGTAGAVTLVGPITVNTITASVAGYTIGNGNGVGGGTNTLTFSGLNPGFNITHTSGTTTSTALLSGIITKTGPGRLEMNNSANPSTSKYIVLGGSMTAPNSNRYGTAPAGLVSDFFTLDGGGLGFNTGTTGIDVGATRGITIGAAGGFLSTTSNTILVTVSSPIVGTANGDVTVGGNPTVWTGSVHTSGGVWTLSNTANSWNGNLILNGSSGTQVKLGASGVIPDSAAITLSAAGNVFDLNGFDETVKSISGSGGTYAVGAKTLTVTNQANATFAGVFSGSAGGKVDLSGTGALLLTGSSTGFNAELVINSGLKVGVGGSNALGAGASGSSVTINGGTLSDTSTSNRSIPATVSLNLAGDFTVDDSLISGPGQILFLGPATIKNANRTITVSGTSTNLGISGAVGEDAAGRGLIKDGTGTLALTGPNTYSGSTTILAGQINISGTSTVGNGVGALILAGGKLNTTASRSASGAPIPNPISVTANSAITTSSTATTVDLNLSSSNLTNNGAKLTFRNDATAAAGVFQPRFSASGLNYTGPIDIVNGAFGTTMLQSFNGTGTTQTFSGVIGGSGSYRRTSSSPGTGGATVFSGANTYSGGTTVADGSIGFGSSTDAGTGAVVSGPVGVGSLNLSASSTAAAAGIFASGGSRVVRNDVRIDTDALIGGSNNLELSGAITVNTTAPTVTVTNTGSTIFSGPITGGGGQWFKSGNGTLTILGAKTYTGQLAIAGGTLSVDTVAVIGQPSSLGQGSAAIGLSGTGATAFEYIGTADATTNRAVAVTNSAGSSLGVTNAATTLTITGVVSGGVATAPLNKYGPGALALGGSSTYTGNILVNQGTLALVGAGSIDHSPLINVAAGAHLDTSGRTNPFDLGGVLATQTLAGNGNVHGTMLVHGVLAPGDSSGSDIGELATEDQNWAGGGQYNWQLADVSSDVPTGRWDHMKMAALVVSSSSGSPFVIHILPANLQNFNPDGTYGFSIASTNGSVTGFDPQNFQIDTSQFAVPGANPNGWSIVHIHSDTSDDIELSYVPEPTGAVAAAASITLLRRWRRRRDLGPCPA